MNIYVLKPDCQIKVVFKIDKIWLKKAETNQNLGLTVIRN